MPGGVDAIAVVTGLALAGLAGNVHCFAMCGPILLGVSPTLRDGPTGRGSASGWAEAAAYHAGRVWTYAMLGGLAGALGERAARSWNTLGFQRGFGVVAGATIVALGIASAISGGRAFPRATRCLASATSRIPGVGALARRPGSAPRFFLGVLSGLLPCGLLYGAIATAAVLGDPIASAGAMIVFGIATVPGPTVAVFATRLPLTRRYPRLATRAGYAALIAAGLFVGARAWTSPPVPCHGDGAVETVRAHDAVGTVTAGCDLQDVGDGARYVPLGSPDGAARASSAPASPAMRPTRPETLASSSPRFWR